MGSTRLPERYRKGCQRVSCNGLKRVAGVTGAVAARIPGFRRIALARIFRPVLALVGNLLKSQDMDAGQNPII